MKRARSTIPTEHHPDDAEQNRLGLERLVFFSDAVFAIAITILVLDVHLPAGADSASDRQLLLLLAGLWHKYLAYLLSFWVIGLHWISHHRKFLLIKRFDHGLLWLNLCWLMVIAFIPFPTAVISENANHTATIFYALVMALAGFVAAILWWHAVRNDNLVDPHLDRRRRWREAAAPLASVVIFLGSIGIAYVDEGMVRILWTLVLPISLFLNRKMKSA